MSKQIIPANDWQAMFNVSGVATIYPLVCWQQDGESLTGIMVDGVGTINCTDRRDFIGYRHVGATDDTEYWKGLALENQSVQAEEEQAIVSKQRVKEEKAAAKLKEEEDEAAEKEEKSRAKAEAKAKEDEEDARAKEAKAPAKPAEVPATAPVDAPVQKDDAQKGKGK